MDNKRLVTATLLCFLVLVGWQFFAEYMGWIEPPAPAQQTETATPSPSSVGSGSLMPEPEVPAALFTPATGERITVETPLYTASFHSGGAILQDFTLKKYKNDISPESSSFNMISATAATVSPMGILLNGQPTWSQGQWSVDKTGLTVPDGGSATLTFVGDLGFAQLTRQITFHADTYLMDEKVTVKAQDGRPLAGRISYTLGVTGFSTEDSSYDPMSMAWDIKGSFDRDADVKDLTAEGVLRQGPLFWGGVMSNYFLAAAAPLSQAEGVYKARIQNGVWRVALEEALPDLTGGQNAVQSVAWWMGPKDRTLLAAAPNQLEKSVDMGMFGILAKPMIWLLNFFQSFVGNYGVAIIVLTVVIKILFWPLTRKSYTSMEQMKRIQPMMKQLQEKHAGNREALSREMMQLYKTYNVNPMSGCLPIAVQLPVFIALYQALLNASELRHASFISYLPGTDIVWLADLSVKDPLYITPIVMGVTMFLQQWFSPAVGDPTQRKMMLLMPVIFTFMFLAFPSGLVLYWLVNNVLSIIQQWWTLRKV